jgi:hypothetical protein
MRSRGYAAHERSLHLNEPSTKNTMSINPKNILKSRAILVHKGCKIIKYLSVLKTLPWGLDFLNTWHLGTFFFAGTNLLLHRILFLRSL